MYQHKYDDNGLASSYLLLTLIVPLALYQYFRLWRKRAVVHCSCSNCLKNRRRKPYPAIIASALLTILIAYLIHNILTLRYATKDAAFDPLEILHISEDATADEIKKTYKKEMRKLKLKARKPQFKAVATEAIKNLNRAFNIMKNGDSYNKWLSNGSEKKLIIALPSFLVNFSTPSLVVYVLVLGFLIPALAYRKYKNFKYHCATGAYFKSVEAFYERINTFSRNDRALLAQLLLFISKREEFTARSWRRDISHVKKTIEEEYGMPLVGSEQGYLHLMDYLARTGQADPADREFAVQAALGLVEAYLQLAVSQGKSVLYESLLVLRKMITQAVLSPELAVLQFPGVAFKDAFINAHCRNGLPKSKSLLSEKKPVERPTTGIDDRSGSKEDGTPGRSVGTPAMDPVHADAAKTTDAKKFLTEHLGGRELKDALGVMHRMPAVKVQKLSAYVLDTQETNSNFNEKLEHITAMEGSAFRLERGAVTSVLLRLEGKAGAGCCHAPMLGRDVANSWNIYYKLNGELQSNVVTVGAFEGAKEITLQLPIGSSKYDVRVYIVSNGYFGIDAEASLLIKYY